MRANGCTIIAKNYLAFARVLAESFRRHHPQGRFFVLLVDEVEDRFRPQDEPFSVIPAGELDNLPDLRSFLFKYTVMESNTAIKPYFLDYLLQRHRLEHLLYFDPDILIYRALDPLLARFSAASILLTPHLTEPIGDDMYPDELAFLRSGAYNLGFLGIRSSPGTQRFLRWWQQRLYDRCVVRFEQGLFVDQKWIDLVPGLFEGVEIVTAPGYNVAYWNLHGRRVGLDEPPSVNGEPLYFFHFSGMRMGSPELVSRHQDRFFLNDLGPAAALFRQYERLVVDAGHGECSSWPYAYARFDNGVPIPDIARALYLSLGRRRARFGDPFASAAPDSFFAWINQPDRAGRRSRRLSRLLHYLYQTHPRLRRKFPDLEGRDFDGFVDWLLHLGAHELALDPVFLAPVLRHRQPPPWTLAGARRELKKRVRRLYDSDLGLKAKRRLKRALGGERTEILRRRLLGPREPGPVLSLPWQVEPVGRLVHLGLNVCGYLEAESGMGEAARSLVAALRPAGVPHSLNSLDLNVLSRQEDRRLGAGEGDFRYDINLLVANADQVPHIYEHLGPEVFAGRHNVGFWLWELETFPEQFHSAFRLFHEIWTPSTFCLDALSAVAPIPVRRVPLPLRLSERPEHDREHFGLPGDAFVFLFVFDFLSYFVRKNPMAVIQAFRQAFGGADGVLLVLKTASSELDPLNRERLLAAADGRQIRVLEGHHSRQEIDDLIRAADCYVSLHRSEGFGLTIAEALALGKPVVATAYSGCSDYFGPGNGWPVPYRLVELSQDVGPYPAGTRWAEPDLEEAAARMRFVYENHEAAREVALRGQREVQERLAPAAVGRLLQERFFQILRSSRHQGSAGSRLVEYP